MSQQSARRSALDAQAARRKERADREPRLEALVVAVLTAFGGAGRGGQGCRKACRGGAAGDKRRRTVGREAVGWCSTGITVRELTRLRRLARNPQDGR